VSDSKPPSPKKEPLPSTPPADYVVEVDDSPTEKRKKGLFSVFSKAPKRKQADLSPDQVTSSSAPSRSRLTLVGVVVPPPPLPHSSYLQLSHPSLASSSNLEAPQEVPTPPISSSPSLASFDSRHSDSGAMFEVNRLRLLLNASQEELRIEKERFAEQERRTAARAEAERALYVARIDELQKERGMGSGLSRLG
jgi:hypothetical protein